MIRCSDEVSGWTIAASGRGWNHNTDPAKLVKMTQDGVEIVYEAERQRWLQLQHLILDLEQTEQEGDTRLLGNHVLHKIGDLGKIIVRISVYSMQSIQ